MKNKLLISALTKVTAGIVLVAGLIFQPAGDLRFWQGWLLMGILFIPMLAAGFVMLKKAPELLARRLDAKEKQSAQKGVVGGSALMFIAGFILAGLNHRFCWYTLPPWASIVGAVLFLASYVLYAFVLKQNAYLSRTIRVEEGQSVVDSGLYGIVRHPMYSATLLLFLSMPIVLGSVYALLVFLIYPVLILVRIHGEEQLLEAELAGYSEYKKKVRWKLIPFVY